jgi:hypothetical protein
MAHDFYIVDVFAERPYAGNRLVRVGGRVIPTVEGRLL